MNDDITMKRRWDERYSVDHYLFGTEPNDFLKSVAGMIPPASAVLCLADGEGRNGVYLAGLGHRVTSIDQSAVGLRKAEQLAGSKGVQIRTVTANLAEHDLGVACMDAVVSIFFHIPPEPREQIYRKVERALKPGGLLILESYTPAQLKHGTGGPPVPELMLTAELVRQSFPNLAFERCQEIEREVIEGSGHTGLAAVVQAIGRRAA